MAHRGKTLLLALVLAAAAAAPSAAGAQVSAPRLIEDGDDAVDETPPARGLPRERTPIQPPAPPPASPPVRPPPGGVRNAAPPAGPASAPGIPTVAPPVPGPASSPGTLALPPPPPPPTTAAELARRIVPVSTTYAKLLELWAQRRTAQREADPVRAESAEKALLAARRDLGIENLFTLSAAEVRDAHRALASNLPAEAVAHAQVAVELAPDFPDAHLSLARARFAQAPGSPGAAFAALAAAIGAGGREPHTARAFYGDLLGAGFAAAFTAAMATALLLSLRRLRLFLHDFHHLPLVRGTAFVQASFLALVLLGMPVAMGLGPFAAVAVLVLATWLYLGTAERIVASAALLVLVALPWAAASAAGITAWTGSIAERVHEIEHGAISDQEAAELAARWAGTPAPAPVYAALGRHHKRRGNLDEALRLYRLAASADERAPEIQVNLGNVLFLQGDLEGAKAAYLAAADRAGGDLEVLGAAHYDLSKLYLRTSDMDKSAAAREKAEREAGEYLRLHGSDDDFSANRYLVDVPVPERKVLALAASDGTPEAVSVWVRQRIAGGLPRGAWPWGAAAFVVLLWLVAFMGSRAAPAKACERCGRPACRRCDAGDGALCGQCVNVFLRKGVVDARDRLRKEAQVRHHEQFRQVATRILAIVGGGAGHLFDGAPVKGALYLAGILFAAFVIWFWRGIMPPPQPSPYVLLGKLAVAAPLGVLLWALAIRDAFRRTNS